MSQRPRDKILANLEAVYRDAYERAKSTDDKARMLDLDASFQREQLLLEVLMDVRDAVNALGAAAPRAPSALEQFNAIRRIAKPG